MPITKGKAAGDVGADDVGGDQIASCSVIGDVNSVAEISRDDVSGPAALAADRLLLAPPLIKTPCPALPMPADPFILVPIKLPSTRLSIVPAAVMYTPVDWFPDIKLPACADLPPIVLSTAPPETSRPPTCCSERTRR